MLYGKLYKKYYPIMSIDSIEMMDNKERNELAHKVATILKEIDFYNMDMLMKGVKAGFVAVRQIRCDWNKEELLEVAERIKVNSILESDIPVLNDVLYRHKYNRVLTFFVFPVQKIKKR